MRKKSQEKSRQGSASYLLSPEFRTVFEEAYQAWLEARQEADCEGQPMATLRGDSLYQDLLKRLRSQ
jgi:hypothetical protein